MTRIILLSFTITFLFSTNVVGDNSKKDCSSLTGLKNLYKKMVCKTDNATSGITEKKTLTDFISSDLLKEKK